LDFPNEFLRKTIGITNLMTVDESPPKPPRSAIAPDAPAFEHVEGHEFAVGEDVFVIDRNGYDIWEGQVVAVGSDKIAIHYPDYPEDDEELAGTDRLLAVTDANKAIYAEMEEARKTPARPPKKQSTRTLRVPKKTKPKGSRSNPKRAAHHRSKDD
jgi:hypothetical protein